MKSKVILFCVLLFCSKFVDSVPHPEELVRQRAFQPTNWPANNYAAGQYVDTNFAQTQNENVLKNSGLQLENNQDYYVNQRTRGFESQGYNKGLSSSLLGKERLLNYAPSVEEERVNSYPIRSNSYPSSAPQIGLDNQQFGFQNWRPQNQYVNPGPIQEVIPINDRPLVRTVQEPYRGPVQYVKPQYIPPVNRRHHSVDRFYPTREQLQYPIDNIGLPGSVSTKYVQTSAPVSVVRESVPYDNYANNQGTASENTAGVVASKQFFASESGSPYNGAPDVISSDVLAEQSRNNGYELNQSSQSDSANTADVATIVNDSQDVVAAESFNAENRPSTLLPVENKSEAAAIIQKVLADKPLVHRYANNYRPGSNWNNYAREGSYNGASVSKTNTFEIHSGNAKNNYGSEFVPKKPASINTYSKPAASHVVATSSLGHKNAEAVPQYTSTTPAPLENTDSENNFYRQLTSGIHKYDLKNIASHPKIKDLLAVNNKPYVLIHANGSVEYFDKFDIDAKENSKYRLIHTKHTPSGKPQGAQGDKVIKPQSPTFIPTSTTTPAPSQLANGGIPKPPSSSNEWTDDSSYLSKPGDDKTPELSPLYRKHHDADSYSTSPHPHVKLPAGNDDSATAFSNVNQPQNDIYSQTLVSKESHSSNGDQPDKNENFKPTASDDGLNSDDVNKSDDDSTPKPLVSDSQSSHTEDSKPGFASANQSNKSNNGNDDTKSLPHKVTQPDDDSTPKPQSLNHGKQASKENQSDDDDDDLSSISNVKQPYDDSTSKPVPSQNKQIVNGDNSKPVSSKDNQSDNNNSKNSQSPKGNQKDNDDFSSDNVKWSDDNSNTKPQSSKDNKSPNSDDSKPFSPNDNKSDNGDDNKPQKHSPKDSQSNDKDNDSSSTSDVNGKNDQSIKKDSKPFSSDDNKSDNGDDNKPQKHSSKDNQSNDSDDDSSSTSDVNGKNDQSIKKGSKPSPSDDNESDNSDDNKPQNQSPKDNQPDNDSDDSSSTSNVNGKNDQSIKKDSKPSPSDDNESDNSDDNKPQKHSTKDNQPNDNGDNSSSTSDVNGKNDESIKKDSQPSTSDDNESDNSDDNKPQKHSPKDKQPDDDSDDSSSKSNANGKNDQSSPKKDNQSPKHDDANSSPSKVTESHDDSNSNANNSPFDDEKPKSTTPSSSTTNDNPTSTTSSPVASDQSTPSNKENSVTSTTSSPDATTEDEIITLSPIETATDNVSDAPSTTTIRPNKSHPRFHIGTPKSSKKDNAQDDSTASSTDSEKKQTSTQESQSSSALQSENTSDSNKSDIEKNSDSTSQTKNEKNDNKAGDADSSSDDKSVVIKINTNDSNSADSKTSKANDFEKNQTNKDENTNQNLEIDVTNIEGEPTMWIRTTNQDFIEKLASKNDTQFDVIYFFNMNPQPTIEREKVTTIHCNGTVVIEKTETSYASQDDKTPKVVKTTTVLQIEDYEP
uniref:Uncharacterized protein n=1 Tax=Heliothis virescens TaxID=7102 RepID=A0A2A4J9S5_HELVI